MLAAAAGVQAEPILVLDSPTHPAWPDWRPRKPTINFPLTPFQFEWMVRWSRGLGAGLQVDAQASLPAPGFGAGLGFKWELPLPEQSPVAVALSARGHAMVGGTDSNGYGSYTWVLTSDPGAIVSFDLPNGHALYLSPRIRWDWVYNSSWVDENEASSSAGMRSYGGAVGWKLPVAHQKALFVEINLIYSPHASRNDGWRGLVGFGWKYNPFEEDDPPPPCCQDN